MGVMNTSHFQRNETASSLAADTDFGTNVGEKLLENPEAQHLFEYGEDGTSRHERNVGRTEQKIRLVAGTALLSAAALSRLSPGWRIAMGAFGAMEIITGSTRFCPLWAALGVNTTEAEERWRARRA